jgi:hypothetical protein
MVPSSMQRARALAIAFAALVAAVALAVYVDQAHRQPQTAPPIALGPTAPTGSAPPVNVSDQVKNASCPAAQLTIVTQPIDMAAGTHNFRLILTNQGRPCLLQGYPDITGIGATGRTVMHSEREPGFPAPIIHLRAGQSASAYYHAVYLDPPPCPQYSTVLAKPPNVEGAHRIHVGDPEPLWYCDLAIRPLVPGDQATQDPPHS